MKKRMNKKAISGVVTAVLMIGLVMVAGVIVWVVVTNLVQGQLGDVESCFGVYEKVKINDMYTCYDTNTNDFQFSLSIDNLDVDAVIVSVYQEGAIKSYTLTNQSQNITGLGPYPSTSGNVTLPGKNSGLTYISTEFAGKPDSVTLAPIINKKQCEVSASLSEIDDCAAIT